MAVPMPIEVVPSHRFMNVALSLGFVQLWGSVIVISWGAYIKSQSPDYESKAFERLAIDDLGGLGAALAVALMPVTVAGSCIFVGLLFTGGVFFLHVVSKWRRDIEIFLTGIFCCGCLLGTLLGLGAAADEFSHGENTIAFGYLLSAAGLAFGTIGLGWPVAASALVQQR